MIIIYKLKEAGVDTDTIIGMLGGNEALYLSILRKFTEDQNYYMYKAVIKTGDIESAEAYIHTLKGVAANLGFAKLRLVCSLILNEFKYSDEVHLNSLNKDLDEEYNRIINILTEKSP